MGYTPLLRGRVQGLARGVDVPNATPDASGLASVNPIFTFVRLAQRVPVRIHIDEVPDDVKLVAGMTATVQIEPFKAAPLSDSKPAPGKVGQADVQPASFQTLADATPQTAPSGSRQTGDDTVGSARASRQPASRRNRSTAARRRRWPPPPQRQASDELSVSRPPSPEAAAAAEAAAADLKTLQQQIAAFPPSGAGSAKSDGGMPSSEFLGQTYDLFGGQSATPKPRSPDTIRQARPLEMAPFAAPIAVVGRLSANHLREFRCWRRTDFGRPPHLRAPVCLPSFGYRQKFRLEYTLIHTGELKSPSNPGSA